MPFLESFKVREPEDALDVKLLSDISNVGYQIVGISADGDMEKLEYAFTVGCYFSFGIPEVVLHGMRWASARSLIAAYVDWGKTRPVAPSPCITEDLANFPLLLREVDLSWYRPLLGYGIWFYRDLGFPFPCLQIAWPDQNGNFDHEKEFDARYRTIQPNLSSPRIES